jgi:hypothetical protein
VQPLQRSRWFDLHRRALTAWSSAGRRLQPVLRGVSPTSQARGNDRPGAGSRRTTSRNQSRNIGPTTDPVSTTLFAFLRSGDTVPHSRPLYGGTETLPKNQMGAFGIAAFGSTDGTDLAGIRPAAEVARAKGRIGLIFVETLANPTNGLVDLKACATPSLGPAPGSAPPCVMAVRGPDADAKPHESSASTISCLASRPPAPWQRIDTTFG